MITDERLYEMHLNELRQEIAYNQLVREAESTRKQKGMNFSKAVMVFTKKLAGVGIKVQGALLGSHDASPVQAILIEKSV